MKSQVREKINFNIPLSICKGIVNADADVIDKSPSDFNVDEMLIEGLAATPKLDLDRQVLKPSGFILDYFLKNGFLNWNHQGGVSPDAIIGEPIDAYVKDEEFYLKGKLYSWSNLAKSVYKIAKNLEEDLTTDRTLGFSIEGMTLKTDKNDLVSQLLVTGCACCFVPKNDDTYLRICKGVTIEEVRELRKSFIFSPVYSEVVEGNKIDYILNLNVGEQQVLVDSDYNFHIRENPLLKASSIQDIQKAVCVLAQGYKEGFIKKDKKDELAKILRDKASQFKTII